MSDTVPGNADRAGNRKDPNVIGTCDVEEELEVGYKQITKFMM